MTHASTDALALFPPSRAEALDRLERFLPRAGREYAATRNADHGPENRENVSTLSPYIRRRLLTEEEVIAAVLRRHSFQAAEKFVQEAFWRTYWKGWLELRPAVHERYRRGLAMALDEMREDDRSKAGYEAATSGETGIEGFDDWARELVATGYIHNHARMWFASIWIFTLRLPWELGADFFMRHLLDGDPASNTLSWRWVGGLQTQGKTYLARADNIARYTDGRFSPEGLAETAHPLSGEPHPPPRPLPPPETPPEGPVALLVTEEDCFVETLDLGDARVTAIGAARASEGVSPGMVSQNVHAFAQGALDDAAARAQARFDAAAHAVPLTAGALSELAREAGARTIVTAYPPVGPSADALGALEPALAEEGVRIVRVMRPFDARAWPHATRGFFQFRERIPVLLAQGGLA
ncbi:MAG: DNA photolyase [Salinarimonadaceae bacterium]|nr:MAG: DNA photolyase [Salinarimonadaceae bacterium]